MKAGHAEGRVRNRGSEVAQQAVGLELADQETEIQLPWWRRKRADSPSPICIVIRISLVRSTVPGMPIQIGRSVPRARTLAIHRGWSERRSRSG